MAKESVGLAGDADELEKELTRITDMAEGRTSGIESTHFSTDTILELQKVAEKADEKAAEAVKTSGSAGLLAMMTYAAAAYRDASYATYGRKYMRIRGLQSKARATYNRALQLIEAEEGTK